MISCIVGVDDRDSIRMDLCEHVASGIVGVRRDEIIRSIRSTHICLHTLLGHISLGIVGICITVSSRLGFLGHVSRSIVFVAVQDRTCLCFVPVLYLCLVSACIIGVLRLVPELVYDSVFGNTDSRKGVGIRECSASIFLRSDTTSGIVGVLDIRLSFRIDELRDGVVGRVGSAGRVFEADRLGRPSSVIESNIL